jgi:histidinol-phosphate aminotransferase
MRLRESLTDIKPYEPGKPIEEVQRELGLKEVYKLASNENALGPSPKALAAIAEALPNLHRYPESSGILLRQDLAAFYGVNPQQVILGNGSDELLQLAAFAFVEPGDRTLTAECTFSEYAFCSQLVGAPCDKVPLKNFAYDLTAMARAVDPRTKVVYISNPNNPTGTYVSHEQLESFVSHVPAHVLVVVDEAYAEYVRASDFPKTLKLVNAYANLLMLRTCSKAYGLAGLRIGYGIGSEAVIGALNKVRQPFNVNSLAQAAARAALQDQDHVKRSQKLVIDHMPLLENGLRRAGCKPVLSQANFIFTTTPIAGRYVFQQLLSHGVIVRPMDAFGQPKAIRVTLSTLPEIGKLLGYLPEIFSKE